MINEIYNNYVEDVYAGWLGKIIGVRHGAKIENWSYESIKKTYGEIKGYIHDFKNFAADDDINGPVYFLRAIDDYTYTEDITAEEMGLNLLNYVPDHHGFFWFGGYGKSTENTAYLNLKNGIMAPRSGSIEQNGKGIAEQIGGQIFIDIWGFIAPGQPELAAEYAEKMASVTHDGNAKYGGMFIAACIAEAFIENDIEKVIEKGLSVIPADCEYSTMSRDVIKFYKEYPDNWRDCFHYVKENYGYDRYPGICHVIPNSAVIILSLLYSCGGFSDAINICNMCGWDTDCNVGNVGAIVGVLNGLEGIDDHWREPINDFLCNSGLIGSLNIMDIPWLAAYTADFGYKIAGEEPPAKWEKILKRDSANYHFEFPGSTQSFRVDCEAQDTVGFVKNENNISFNGERSLKVVFNRTYAGQSYRTFIQTYYTPADFDDSRYDPAFSPILYPGQNIEIKAMLPGDAYVDDVEARLYVRERNQDKYYYGEKVKLTPGDWQKFNYSIPSLEAACLSEAGIELIPVRNEKEKPFIIYIDDFNFSGIPNYSVDFGKETMEEWEPLHLEVSQFTYLRGMWKLEDGELSGSYCGEPAEAYTGDIQWQDYTFTAVIIPKLGQYHNINFRVQGAIRSYAVGLAEDKQLVLYKNDNGYKKLKAVDFEWDFDNTYKIRIAAVKNNFKIYVESQLLIEYIDENQPYLKGMVGFSNFQGSHTHYKSFKIED